jgi:hydroxymethylbilane synthase
MSTASPLTVRIASRASQLAMWQARHVTELIRQVAPELTVEIVPVTTSGDANQTDSLRSFGGLGVFTREVQKLVQDGRADLAVHSLKDLPTAATPGLALAGVPDRAETADAFLAPSSRPELVDLQQLPVGARVGTGSLRRQAQLLSVRPDLQLAEVRGNVDTRLRKLDEGEYDALILATAGLVRLGLGHRIRQRLGPPLMLPAVGQGALGIECRADDEATCELLGRLTNPRVLAEVSSERALLAALRAGCHAPVGAFCRATEDRITLEAVVLSPNGAERVEASGAARPEFAVELGRAVAEELSRRGADRLLRQP